jgi:lysophospholipase L1-like esterase
MKKILITILILAGIVLLSSACDEYNELTAPVVNTGSADFTRFVVVGDNITAGYQSSSLYESAQMYSFGNIIANHIKISFEQPLYSDPGTIGRLEIVSIQPFLTTANSKEGKPINSTLPRPYNNLGIPGALLYDVLNATNANNCASALFAGKPNPMFDLVLRNSALNIGSQFQQAATLNPTFVTLWIGNNDVLGFATSGGTSPSSPTDVGTFTLLYNATAGAFASLGTKVAVGNVFDVSTIAFFTTVGPQMAFNVPWGYLASLGAPGIIYQQHGETIGSGIADSLKLLTGVVYVTLPGGSYAGLIGQPTGKFYRDYHFPIIPPGIDTTKPFGVHPQNPWPDALTLDQGEIATVQSTVQSYNNVIKDAATANGFALADVNTLLKNIRANDFTGGTNINGITFKTTYVTGGLFSLDGVHPSSQAQGIIANAFLSAINSKFSAKIPLVDVSTIPGSLIFTKLSTDKYGYPHFANGAFDHLLF